MDFKAATAAGLVDAACTAGTLESRAQLYIPIT
jgi:hypothetical protein